MLLILSLGFTGLVSAKSGEVSFKAKAVLQYGYLYQSTCGWTFNMYTDTPIGQMSASQYDDYMDELIETNDRICKLHGVKPVENFTFNLKNSFNVITKERI